MSTKLADWLAEHDIAEAECIVPDMNGVQRGEWLLADKFLSGPQDGTLRIPDSVFLVNITGEYPGGVGHIVPVTDPDRVIVPDAATIWEAPGFKTRTADVIADAFDFHGAAFAIELRMILKRVLQLYALKGWQPVIAPEVEFYLVSRNLDPDFPRVTPVGRSGRPETASQPYDLEALNEFEEIVEHIDENCEKAGLDINIMIYESGAAQREVNFLHGNALRLADEVQLFKRIVRQVALARDVYVTFLAKSMNGQPGSAMHIHQSVLDVGTGKNIFSRADGRDSSAFRSYVAGLARLPPQVAPMFASNVNSFRRMRPDSDAPINVHWGSDRADGRRNGPREPSDCCGRWLDRGAGRGCTRADSPDHQLQHRYRAARRSRRRVVADQCRSGRQSLRGELFPAGRGPTNDLWRGREISPNRAREHRRFRPAALGRRVP